jgi:hypothetical protein
MSSLSVPPHVPSRYRAERRVLGRRRYDAAPWWWTLDARRLTRLASTPGGWALLSYSGEAIYQAEGPESRRRCLERACELGVQCLIA